MEKHTPGPWETSSNAEGQWDVCKEYAGDMIADLKGTDNQEANARLIAKAPEMLEALRECADLLDRYARGEYKQEYFNIKARARAILKDLED